MPPLGKLSVLFVAILLIATAKAQQSLPGNLALTARASASSQSEGTKPENLTAGGDRQNGITDTQWTAKEGTSPADTWIELNWPSAVQFQEVVVRQEGAPKLSHVDLETRGADGKWHLLQSIGDSQHLLPVLILAQFAPQNTNGLRLSGFAGRVSLMEVEAYNRNDPPVVSHGIRSLESHLRHRDRCFRHRKPFANVPVQFKGTAGGKRWQASVQTNDDGMFQVDMPVGLEGADYRDSATSGGARPHSKLCKAGDLTPGLSITDDSAILRSISMALALSSPIRMPDFFQADFSDSDWKDIKVPSHWMMEGFDSKTGTGGYRRHLQIPASFQGRRIKLLFDAVYSGAEVWLNGQRVGSHEGGFSPFELDITDAAHIGRRQSAGRTGAREDSVVSPGQHELLRQLPADGNFPPGPAFQPAGNPCAAFSCANGI